MKSSLYKVIRETFALSQWINELKFHASQRLKKLKLMQSRYKVSKIIADTSKLMQSEVLEDIFVN